MKLINKNNYKWSLFSQGNLFIFHQRELTFIRILKYYNIFNLQDKKLLDLGCGCGFELNNLIKYGLNPKNLYGIDIRAEAIFYAKNKNPNINFILADARYLPFKNCYFDLEMQYTMFSSILNLEDRKIIAKEMVRVLKNSGLILWYDFFVNNPFNKETKSIKKNEIIKLFYNCKFYFKKITLAPQLCRIICKISDFICLFFEKLKIFCTHYYVGIQKYEK